MPRPLKNTINSSINSPIFKWATKIIKHSNKFPTIATNPCLEKDINSIIAVSATINDHELKT